MTGMFACRENKRMQINQGKTRNIVEPLSGVFSTIRLFRLAALVTILLPLVSLSASSQTAKLSVPAGIQYVSPNGSNSHNGASWSTSKATIAGAIAALPKNKLNGGHGKIYLAAGIYKINSTLTLQAGTTIEGLAGSSSPTTIEASYSFPANTPLIAFGTGGEPEGIQLRHLAVDCNNVSGAIGVENANAQENSGLDDVSIINCPGIGLEVANSPSGGGQGSFYMNIRSVDNSACTRCSTSTIPVKVDAGLKYIKGLTIDAREASAHPSIGLLGKTIYLSNAHCEGVSTCYEVASGSVLQVVDCGGGSAAAAVNTCVSIDAGSNGVAVYGLNAGGNLTNLLVDPSRAIEIPSRVTYLPFYVVGSGPMRNQVVLSSDHDLPFQGSAYRMTNGNYLVSSGRITLSDGMGSHRFATKYVSAPICTANDESRELPVQVRSTRTTVYVTGNKVDIVQWICTPAAN